MLSFSTMSISFIAGTPISLQKTSQHPYHVPKSIRIRPHQQILCVSINSETAVRRSANYEPTLWDYDYIQRLNSVYTGEVYKNRAKMLKENVRDMIGRANKPLDKLELIDKLQRLGLAYHFKAEIKKMLQEVYNNIDDQWKRDNLYAMSLQFRLFRQHSFYILLEDFNLLKDKSGSFQACLCEDVKGMLSLYEASYYGFEKETILKEAWQFTNQHLRDLKTDTINTNLALEVKHALELPLHQRVNRLEARWFIDHYQNKDNFNPTLLEFAKLDYNIVQGLYRQELKEAYNWWKQTDLGDHRLSFARDSLVISFIWTVGTAFEPQYSSWRILNTKINNLISYIDDIYDVYGTLHELELFTDVVGRWDIQGMKNLPNYMSICFLALFNIVNEMAYNILKEQDLDLLLTIKNSWTGLLQAYLMEAKWFYCGYKPSMEEYIENGLNSISAPMLLLNQYISAANPITKEELEYLESKPDILICLAKIARLQNDLGNSSDELKRGDVLKSVQCFMTEYKVSEKVAREEIDKEIRRLWKKVNLYQRKELILSKNSVQVMVDHIRMFHCVYLNGDGHAVQEKTKNLVLPLLFESIPM